MRAEVERRALKVAGGAMAKPAHWGHVQCLKALASSPRGFAWTDPEPAAEPAAAPSASALRAHIEGVRAINYVHKHPDAFRATKMIDSRAALDATRAMDAEERRATSFWRSVATAVMSTEEDPDIDSLQQSSIHFEGA